MAYTTIDDPSAHFQTLLWTGDDSSRSLTNTGNSNLQPDWIWTTSRSNGYNNGMFDSSRGANKELTSNTNNAEATLTTGVSAFNSNGFSFSGAAYNTDGYTFVGWQWKANGGTTSSNSDGDITATVQANTTAGFSIVTYTGNGNGSDQTVGHGLGAECKLVFQKMRTDAGQSWRVFHESVSQSGGGNLFLNSNGSLDTGDPARIKSTNTSTFTLLAYTSPYNGVNASGKEYVAYCFAEKKGYSKIGSFTGNGNADGAFVYTGFKPAWLMTKRISGSGQWSINDIPRHPFNVIDRTLLANQDHAETTSANYSTDFLSNGFKLRTADDAVNDGTYVYLAFAEQPFVATNNAVATAF